MAIDNPEAGNTGSAPTTENLSDVEFLEADDDAGTEETTETPETPEAEETSDEEIESELESEEEVEEVPEEETEEETTDEDAEFQPAIGRPKLADIKKEFPTLLKKFPAIREIYYREASFTEIFPTVDDAKEAESKSSTLDFLDNELTKKGDPSVLINNLPDESIANIADLILPGLAKRNPELYMRAVGPALKKGILAAAKDGQLAKNESLVNAAVYLHNYFFETPDLNAPLKFGKQNSDDPEIAKQRKELDQRIEAHNKEKQTSFDQSIYATSNKLVKEDLVKTFDPNNALPDITRNLLIKSIIDEVDEKLGADKNFMQKVKSIRIKAAQAGYTKEYKTRLISAYLGAFRALVGPVRQRVKQEALGKLTTQKQAPKKRFIPAAGKSDPAPRIKPVGKINPKDVDWSKTSDLDFLEDKVTMKRRG